MSRILLSARLYDVPEFDNPGRQQGLSDLARYGSVEMYPIKEELTAPDARDVVAMIADASMFADDFYEEADQLRIISRRGVGFESVNLDLATRTGVLVTIAPEHVETVAEFSIAMWLACMRRVFALNQLGHGGTKELMAGLEVRGSTLGIYGLGRIGQWVARKARPLVGDEGRVLAYDVRPDLDEVCDRLDVEHVTHPRTLMRESDAVAIHVSGSDRIVTEDLLACMKPHASLINPSRGGLVDPDAVKNAIQNERLFYYAVDEPLVNDLATLRGVDRVIATSHCSGITPSSFERLDRKCFAQVIDALEGRRPDDIVNEDVLQHPRVREWLEGR